MAECNKTQSYQCIPTEALKEFGPGFTEEQVFRHIVVCRPRSIRSSYLAEVCSTFAKASKLIKGKKKYRRPQQSFGVSLSKNIVSVVHKYYGVPIERGQKIGSRFLQTRVWVVDPKMGALFL